MPPEPNDEEKLEQLPEDNETPFRPAEPPRDPDNEPDDDAQPGKDLDGTHPATDTGMQKEQLYEDGVGEAAVVEEPNKGNAVTGYSPKDQKQEDIDNESL
jgi:hypothetical protein